MLCTQAIRSVLVIGLAAMMAGCSSTPPVSAPDLVRPSADLMVDPDDKPMPDIPACEADIRCRLRYYAEERGVCALRGDQVRGLQKYVNVVTKKR